MSILQFKKHSIALNGDFVTKVHWVPRMKYVLVYSVGQEQPVVVNNMTPRKYGFLVKVLKSGRSYDFDY